MTPTPDIRVGEADAELEAALGAGLDVVNHAVTGIADERAISVRVDDAAGLVAGLRGWSWGVSAGISLLWVREDSRGDGWGSRLVAVAEQEARARGCARIAVSSFTFQAPAFYERLGYVETGRSFVGPRLDDHDVHLVKVLGS